MGLLIFYWRGSAEKRADLIQALSSVGAEVEEYRHIEDILDVVEERNPALIIADASAGERETSNRVIELSSTPSIYNVPLAFLGIQAGNRLSALEQHFAKVAAVDVPFRLSHAVKQIIGLLGPDLAEVQAAINTPQAPAQSETTDKHLESSIDVEEKEPEEQITEAQHSNRTTDESKEHVLTLIEELPPLGKPDTRQGNWIASRRSLAAITADAALPNHPMTAQINGHLDDMKRISPWLALNGRRVGTLSRSIIEMLDGSKSRAETIELCGSLMNVGHIEHIGKKPSSALSSFPNFLTGDGRKNIPEFTEVLSKSADILAEMPDGERACIVLALASAMLEGQVFEDEEDVTIDAQCLVVAELIGRACWRTGVWNPLGAYRVIRELRNQETIQVHPVVSRMFVRLLGEAVRAGISSTKKQISLPKENEQNVSIYSLSPGMRIAQPVESVDGAIVLGEQVLLDGDLIWRLWQLSAIRPIDEEVKIKMH